MTHHLTLVKSVSAAFLVVVSASAAYLASRMAIYSAFGPGPGLFPLVLGCLLTVLTLIWLVQPDEAASAHQGLPMEGVIRVGTVIVSVALAAWLMPYLGFLITSSVLIFTVMRVTGKNNLLLAAGIAVIASIGFYALFRGLLNLSLPMSQLPIVSSIGL